MTKRSRSHLGYLGAYLGNAVAVILAYQIDRWSRRSPNGWVTNTLDDWAFETGFSRDAVYRALTLLKSKSVVDTKHITGRGGRILSVRITPRYQSIIDGETLSDDPPGCCASAIGYCASATGYSASAITPIYKDIYKKNNKGEQVPGTLVNSGSPNAPEGEKDPAGKKGSEPDGSSPEEASPQSPSSKFEVEMKVADVAAGGWKKPSKPNSKKGATENKATALSLVWKEAYTKAYSEFVGSVTKKELAHFRDLNKMVGPEKARQVVQTVVGSWPAYCARVKTDDDVKSTPARPSIAFMFVHRQCAIDFTLSAKPKTGGTQTPKLTLKPKQSGGNLQAPKSIGYKQS